MKSHKTSIQKQGYIIEILHGVNGLAYDDNADVDVFFDNNEKYGATFFTLKSIYKLMKNYAHTGECLSGTYFYASNMLLIDEMSAQKIELTIEDLIYQNELKNIFEKYN